MAFNKEQRQQPDWNIQNLIIESITTMRITNKILKCLFVINIMEKKGKATKELLKSKENLETMFSDIGKYRKFAYRDSLMENHPSEYFGRDFSKEDPFSFDTDVEKVNIEVSKMVVEALAIAYTELGEGKGGVDLQNLLSGEFGEEE